jgi:hypothetical protein
MVPPQGDSYQSSKPRIDLNSVLGKQEAYRSLDDDSMNWLQSDDNSPPLPMRSMEGLIKIRTPCLRTYWNWGNSNLRHGSNSQGYDLILQRDQFLPRPLVPTRVRSRILVSSVQQSNVVLEIPVITSN